MASERESNTSGPLKKEKRERGYQKERQTETSKQEQDVTKRLLSRYIIQ
jgi:hypothetical protein